MYTSKSYLLLELDMIPVQVGVGLHVLTQRTG